MKVFVMHHVFIGLCLLITLLFDCSLQDSYSGGAGAGNPIYLSMQAMGANALYPILETDKKNVYRNPYQEIHIHDSKNMRIKVSKVFITAQKIYFPVPKNMNTEHIKKPLYLDANQLVLDGPFVFDILNGSIYPPLGVFNLPHGSYSHLSMKIGEIDTQKITPDIVSIIKGYQIVLVGTFQDVDSVRQISIYIENNSAALFPSENSPIVLSSKDTLGLQIILNEQFWLKNINIKSVIMTGLMQIDEKGNYFFVGDPNGSGPASSKARMIRNNIFNSGTIRVDSLGWYAN